MAWRLKRRAQENGHMHRWDAERYQSSPSDTQKWGRQLVSKLNLEGWERVLDIGCGDGRITAEIAQLVPRGTAVGVDSSPEMVAVAQRTYPLQEFPNLRFQQMDATGLEFCDEFDVVFSNAALHWIADHRPVLKGIHRSLRCSGRLLLQMGGRGNAAEILATVNAVAQDPQWRAYFQRLSSPVRFFGPEGYEALLSEAGLRAKRLELVPKDMVHNGKEGLSSWIRAVWLPYTLRIPETMREDFVTAVVDSYASRHSADDAGLIHIQMVRLEVEAVKEEQPG